MRHPYKEVIGEFTVEKRGCARGGFRYVVTKGTDIERNISFSTKSKARAWAKDKLPKSERPTRLKDMTPEELYRHKEAQHERKLTRDRLRRSKVSPYDEAMEENARRDRVARGLPAEPICGMAGVHAYRYADAMREKHGQDWKPSTKRVFGVRDEHA